MENLWPKIGEIKKTEEVMSFFEELTDSLKENYDGKICGQLCPIKLVLKEIKGMRTALANLSTIFCDTESDKPRYEKMVDIEKNRDCAYVKNRHYKYEIFNSHLYYSLFTINITEFYPIKLVAAAGTLNEDETEIDIDSLDKLRSVVLEIVCSDKVKMIIAKMML